MIILLYHQITALPTDKDPLRLSVSPEQFTEQMDYLKQNNYTCISLEDFVEAKVNAKSHPERAFVITFDDGYLDNYERAFPILQNYNFTATIFLVTNRVGSIVNWSGLENQRIPLMSWMQVREMQEKGFHFGSHTHTHPDLSQCNNSEVEFELNHSKHVLEQELGKPVNLFAYPYESVTMSLEQKVFEAGYLAAFGSLLLPENRLNSWRRECFGSDTIDNFRFKLSDNWKRSVLLKYHSPLGKFLRFAKRRIKQGLSAKL